MQPPCSSLCSSPRTSLHSSQSDIPVDGGKDKKFVVDVPARLRHILERLQREGFDVREMDAGFLKEDAERMVAEVHDEEVRGGRSGRREERR